MLMAGLGAICLSKKSWSGATKIESARSVAICRSDNPEFRHRRVIFRIEISAGDKDDDPGTYTLRKSRLKCIALIIHTVDDELRHKRFSIALHCLQQISFEYTGGDHLGTPASECRRVIPRSDNPSYR